MSRFIDLSVAIESGLPSDPPMMIPKIMYIDHALGAESMKAFYRIFGEDLLLNLNLILIPGPQLADDKICDERLLKLVVTGDYWQPKRWTRLIGQCAESIARREQFLDSVW